MSTTIYYFSGTGNSLAVAGELAECLDTELISIVSAVSKDGIVTDSDQIGIVFPVYNHRIPFIVKRFAEKLREIGSKYVFAVCTYGDSPCISLEYLSGIIHKAGGNLAFGIGIKMPYNYILPSKGISGLFRPFVMKEISAQELDRLISGSREKFEMICAAVKSNRVGSVEVKHRGIEHAVGFLNLRETLQKSVWLKIGGFRGKTDLSYIECVQLMDHSFFSTDQCIRCGGCVRVCPTNNITMTDSGPRWNHRCEQCFACLQWCSKQAIQFGAGTDGGKRYHHPDVTLSDMFAQKINRNEGFK